MELHLDSMSVDAFLRALGSDLPAPGGGAASGLSGSLAAALGKMVADLTQNRKKYELYAEDAAVISEKLDGIINEFRILAEEDAKAYTNYINAASLPKSTDEEVQKRKEAMSNAIRFSTDVPCKVIGKSEETIQLLINLYGRSNQSCAGDLAAGAMELSTACKIAWLNVLANLPYLSDKTEAECIFENEKSKLNRIYEECDSLYQKIETDILHSF